MTTAMDKILKEKNEWSIATRRDQQFINNNSSLATQRSNQTRIYWMLHKRQIP